MTNRVQVSIPSGSHLRMVVKGEEADAVDLSAYAAILIESGARATSKPVADTGIEFATIECSDDVTFTLDGEPLDMARALDLLSIGARDAIKAAVEHAEGAPAEPEAQ